MNATLWSGRCLVADYSFRSAKPAFIGTRRRLLLAAMMLGVVGAAALVMGTGLVARVFIGQFVRLLNLSAQGFVWMVQAAENGWDSWTILAAIGRALGSAISASSVTLAFIGLELVGLVALYVLRRLLRLEKESN